MSGDSEIHAHIVGLEKQLELLKTLVGANSTSQSAAPSSSLTEVAKEKEIQDLKAENQKLNYRITQLMRTVAEKRARINELEGNK